MLPSILHLISFLSNHRYQISTQQLTYDQTTKIYPHEMKLFHLILDRELTRGQAIPNHQNAVTVEPVARVSQNMEYLVSTHLTHTLTITVQVP